MLNTSLKTGVLIFAAVLSAEVSAIAEVTLLRNGNPINSYPTIQACADVTQAGDICRVGAGTYNERVSVTRSGTFGNVIQFSALPGVIVGGFYLNQADFIRVEGFEITATAASRNAGVYLVGADGVEIINNSIHHTVGYGVAMPEDIGSNDVVIRGNTIRYPDSADGVGQNSCGISISGSRVLVENNDVAHVGDFTRVWGENILIRNNYFHDVVREDYPNYAGTDGTGHHVDGMQTWSVSSSPRTSHVFFENNRLLNASKTHSHLAVLQDEEAVGHAHFVVRLNTVQNMGEALLISDRAVQNVLVYHNTAVDVGAAAGNPWETISFRGNSRGGVVMNNIFSNVCRGPGGYVYNFDSSAQPFFADYNLGYDPDCGSSCTWNSTYIGSEPHAILNQNPRFTSTQDLSLQNNSPAIDKAGPLTRVAATDSGSGTTLNVERSDFFQSGLGMVDKGVSADWIAIGNAANSVRIASINYDTHTIVLANAVARSATQSVWLYKDSAGRRVFYGNAPDMGSYELGANVDPLRAPANLRLL